MEVCGGEEGAIGDRRVSNDDLFFIGPDRFNVTRGDGQFSRVNEKDAVELLHPCAWDDDDFLQHTAGDGGDNRLPDPQRGMPGFSSEGIDDPGNGKKLERNKKPK